MSVIQYFKDTKTEMNHVAWPTQEQTIVYTGLVILVSLIIAGFVGFFDFLFTRSLETAVTGSPFPAQMETKSIPVNDGSLDMKVEGQPSFTVEGQEVSPATPEN